VDDADGADDRLPPDLPPLLGLRADAGPATVQSVGDTAAKLARLRAVAVPADLFAGVPVRVLLAYRRRVAAEALHELRRHPDPIRLTLLAAFCHVRGRELADGLTELLITTVHRIGARAEKRVEGELIADIKRVSGKPALLFKLAAEGAGPPLTPPPSAGCATRSSSAPRPSRAGSASGGPASTASSARPRARPNRSASRPLYFAARSSDVGLSPGSANARRRVRRCTSGGSTHR